MFVTSPVCSVASSPKSKKRSELKYATLTVSKFEASVSWQKSSRGIDDDDDDDDEGVDGGNPYDDVDGNNEASSLFDPESPTMKPF